MDFIRDLWGFLRVRKKFWLLPLIIVLLIFGVLIATSLALASYITRLMQPTQKAARLISNVRLRAVEASSRDGYFIYISRHQ